ncbi:MAG: thymidylate kinase [Caulobacter sp.]|nr:thymidylate kinase [Caulobacter sp.]
MFISFEGGEGGGKSTQVRTLADRLRAAGHDVVTTREPGGSPGAEAIRDLLVNGEADRWSPITETLLMYASRRDHLERVIRPGLERGAVVLCDRFADSTRAYQGAAGGAPRGLIADLERDVLEGTLPELTLILDLPVEEGLKRAHGRGGAEARFEGKGQAFHERLRQAFAEIAAAEPERCVLINAAQPLDAVAADIWTAVSERLASGRVDGTNG